MDQINIISGRVTDLELIVAGAAGSASYMIDFRLRAVPVLIPLDPGPVSHVQILQIGKMGFVKKPDLFQQIHPVNRRSGADRKNPTGAAVFCRGLSLASGEGPSQCAVIIPGGIQFFMVMAWIIMAPAEKALS